MSNFLTYDKKLEKKNIFDWKILPIYAFLKATTLVVFFFNFSLTALFSKYDIWEESTRS